MTTPYPVERRAGYFAPDTINFILNLGRALHTYGYAAHRLEAVLGKASLDLGVEAHFFSTPTSIMVAFGSMDSQRTFMIRVQPGEQDLGKLAMLDAIVLQVLKGDVTPAEGSSRIDMISAAPPRYGLLLTALAFGLTSGAATRFLGGGLREIIVSTGLGLVVGALAVVGVRYAAVARTFETVASFLVAFLATVLSHAYPHSVFLATLGGIIVLVPGFTFTVSMIELSTRHLSSGTARLSAAMMTFLSILFGVALGTALGTTISGAPISIAPASVPAWYNLVALLVAPLGFLVLLKAEQRSAPWLVLVGVLAFYSSRLGAMLFGPELGSFVGALAVGVASNLLAVMRDRPSQVYLVPGILLLVPGSVGMRSLTALMEREVISGIETAFRMVVIAVSIVAGILIANVIGPRRSLP